MNREQDRDVPLPNGKRRLFFCLLILTVVWTVVLPAVAQQESVRDYLDWLDEEQIDPSAMFYTELEQMEELLEVRPRDERGTAASR